MNITSYFFKSILDKQSIKFAVGVCLGIGFSISVILCTIGLMDGFKWTIKKSLRESMGDVYLYSKDGFFDYGKTIKPVLEDFNVTQMSAFIQSEGFIVQGDKSQGVSIRAIDSQSFSNVTKMKIKRLDKGEVALGKELARSLKVKVGDEVVLAMAQGNEMVQGYPVLKRFSIKDIIAHNVYEKDSRYMYMNIFTIREILDVHKNVNMVMLNVPNISENVEEEKAVKNFIFDLEDRIGLDFRIKPFWYDFSSIIKAVEIEKLTISLILQVIVIVSIFNVVAFFKFIHEKKSQDFFMFRALGMGRAMLLKSWFAFVFLIWVISCGLSILFLEVFKWCFSNLSFLKLPGEIYFLDNLMIILHPSQAILIFIVTLIWLCFASFLILRKMIGKDLLHGLRKEFS